MAGRPIHRYTYAQYVAIESGGDAIKHEFFDGEIYALPRETEEHAAIAGHVIRTLAASVITIAREDWPCRVNTPGVRIYVEAFGLATFPDGSVICGPLQQHPPGPETTATNPLVLVEVTSDSSESYDTGFKLDAYRTIPSLRDIILVSHRERRITVHHRDTAGAWYRRVATAGIRIAVESLATELVVDRIYRNSSIER